MARLRELPLVMRRLGGPACHQPAATIAWPVKP